MHFWVEHNDRSGKCHADIDDARSEIIDGIIEKMGTARNIPHQVECANGITAASSLVPGGGWVGVGRDTWAIVECWSYGCIDTTRGGSSDW